MKGMEFKLNDINTILAKRGLEVKGRTQQFIDSEVLRRSSRYVPHLIGTLEKSGPLSTEIGSGEVVWNTPYARYQYYGKVMVGAPPKKVTDTDLKYHGGGMRGAFWFERMKVDHLSQILSGAAKVAGGRVK